MICTSITACFMTKLQVWNLLTRKDLVWYINHKSKWEYSCFMVKLRCMKNWVLWPQKHIWGILWLFLPSAYLVTRKAPSIWRGPLLHLSTTFPIEKVIFSTWIQSSKSLLSLVYKLSCMLKGSWRLQKRTSLSSLSMKASNTLVKMWSWTLYSTT